MQIGYVSPQTFFWGSHNLFTWVVNRAKLNFKNVFFRDTLIITVTSSTFKNSIVEEDERCKRQRKLNSGPLRSLTAVWILFYNPLTVSLTSFQSFSNIGLPITITSNISNCDHCHLSPFFGIPKKFWEFLVKNWAFLVKFCVFTLSELHETLNHLCPSMPR